MKHKLLLALALIGQIALGRQHIEIPVVTIEKYQISYFNLMQSTKLINHFKSLGIEPNCQAANLINACRQSYFEALDNIEYLIQCINLNHHSASETLIMVYDGICTSLGLEERKHTGFSLETLKEMKKQLLDKIAEVKKANKQNNLTLAKSLCLAAAVAAGLIYACNQEVLNAKASEWATQISTSEFASQAKEWTNISSKLCSTAWKSIKNLGSQAVSNLTGPNLENLSLSI